MSYMCVCVSCRVCVCVCDVDTNWAVPMSCLCPHLSCPCVFLKLSVSIILDTLMDCVLGAKVQDLQMVLNSQLSVFLPSSWGES